MLVECRESHHQLQWTVRLWWHIHPLFLRGIAWLSPRADKSAKSDKVDEDGSRGIGPFSSILSYTLALIPRQISRNGPSPVKVRCFFCPQTGSLEEDLSFPGLTFFVFPGCKEPGRGVFHGVLQTKVTLERVSVFQKDTLSENRSCVCGFSQSSWKKPDLKSFVGCRGLPMTGTASSRSRLQPGPRPGQLPAVHSRHLTVHSWLGTKSLRRCGMASRCGTKKTCSEVPHKTVCFHDLQFFVNCYTCKSGLAKTGWLAKAVRVLWIIGIILFLMLSAFVGLETQANHHNWAAIFLDMASRKQSPGPSEKIYIFLCQGEVLVDRAGAWQSRWYVFGWPYNKCLRKCLGGSLQISKGWCKGAVVWCFHKFPPGRLKKCHSCAQHFTCMSWLFVEVWGIEDVRVLCLQKSDGIQVLLCILYIHRYLWDIISMIF